MEPLKKVRRPNVKPGDKMRSCGSYGIYMGKSSKKGFIIVQPVLDKRVHHESISPVETFSRYQVDFTAPVGKLYEDKRISWTRMKDQDTNVFEYTSRIVKD